MTANVTAFGIDPNRLILPAQQPAFLRFRTGNQFGHAQAEGAGEPGQQHGGRAAVAAFNFMHHGPRNAGPFGQIGQGPMAGFAFDADACADALI
ncbi:hypothetical protein D3C80_1685510 [compost metagenome]